MQVSVQLKSASVQRFTYLAEKTHYMIMYACMHVRMYACMYMSKNTLYQPHVSVHQTKAFVRLK